MPSLEQPKARISLDESDETRIARIEREAYEQGFASGEKAGCEMGERQTAVLLERLGQLCAEIETARKAALDEIEAMVPGLAREIARKIILTELKVRPDIIGAIVKEAMRRIERTGKITVKINPALQELFMKLKPSLLETHPNIVFDLDPSVTATGSVVIGAYEEVVTDIDEQLKNVIEDMEDGLAGH